jgi:hypothetical protein
MSTHGVWADCALTLQVTGSMIGLYGSITGCHVAPQIWPEDLEPFLRPWLDLGGKLGGEPQLQIYKNQRFLTAQGGSEKNIMLKILEA